LAEGGSILSVKNGLAGLVHLNFCDDAVGWVDSLVDSLTINLISGSSLNMDDILLTVAGDDFALTTLELANTDLDFIVFANRQRSHLNEGLITPAQYG
jgi:hypothetical protein